MHIGDREKPEGGSVRSCKERRTIGRTVSLTRRLSSLSMLRLSATHSPQRDLEVSSSSMRP